MKMRKRVLCLLLMMTLCIQSFMPAYAAEMGLETEETAVQAEEESTGEIELAAETAEAVITETEAAAEAVTTEEAALETEAVQTAKAVEETEAQADETVKTEVAAETMEEGEEDSEWPEISPEVKIYPVGNGGIRFVYTITDNHYVAAVKYKVWEYGQEEPSSFYIENEYEETDIHHWSDYYDLEFNASIYSLVSGTFYGPFYVAAYAYDKAGNESVAYLKKPVSIYPCKPGMWVTGTYRVKNNYAPDRWAPYETLNGKDTTIMKLWEGTEISVIGSYTIDGTEWYQTESGSWIKASDVKRYSLFMTIREALEYLFDHTIVYWFGQIFNLDEAIAPSSDLEDVIDLIIDNGPAIPAIICGRPADEAGTPISMATITFDPNGGSVGTGSISCLTGEEIGPMPVPYRFGYEFDGWFTSADGGDQVDEYSTCSGSMTLYAHWTRIVLLEGDCGPNLHFILYGDGILDITGSGEMDSHPWTDDYAGRVLEANLPDTLTAICASAFEDCTYLGKVNIPGRVKRIEDATFKNCTYLETITIPNSVTSIGTEAFYKCEYLETVSLTNVTEIGDEAFYECFRLKEAPLGNKLTYIGRNAFFSTPLTEVFIPKSLKECGYVYGGTPDEGPFSHCDQLKNVTFENGITTIPDGVFAGCTGLQSIVIPDTVTKMGEHCLSYCPGLSDVTLSRSLTEIGYGVFYGDTALTQISIPDSVRTIQTEAFAKCTNLAKANLPEKMTFLGGRAFQATALTEITVPKSLDYCGYYFGGSNNEGPFCECDQLKKVSFEEGIEVIPEGLMAGCTGIESIVIPDTVLTMEEGCLGNCSNLSSVTLSSKLQTIGVGVFEQDVNLKSISLPDTLTEIHEYCFSGSGLEQISIPASLSLISWGAFQECRALKKVTLPAGSLERINNEAFMGCVSLEEIEIPLGVTEIGTNAFYECSALKKAVIPDSVYSVEEYAFYDCDALTEVSLSKGITSIPRSAFEDCDSLESILIPYRVTEIGPDVFKNDISFTSITIPKSVTSIDESAFSYPQNLTIYGVAGSYAEAFANENDIRFVAINVPATEIALSETEITLEVGDEANLYFTIAPDNFTDDIVWESSDPNVATIDEDGLVEAVGGGTAVITITAGAVSSSCTVTSIQHVRDIEVKPYTAAVEEGETLQLTATVYPADASNKTVHWSSSDESIASVDENGLVTAKAVGTAEITAASDEYSEITASSTITVKAKEPEEKLVTSITLSSEDEELEVGETLQLTATVLPEDAADKTLEWSSTNPSVATVDSNGLVTAKAAGLTMITATAADRGVINAVCAIKVTEKQDDVIPATDIYFFEDSADVPIGTSFVLIAHIKPENANNDYTVTWTSNNPDVASVENNMNMVTVHKYGTAIITATLHSGNLTKTAKYTIHAVFNDVMDSSAYYYKPVYWAAKEGITTGYSDGSFGVGRDCQRRELLIFMWRFAGQPTKDKNGKAYGDARKMFNDMNAYGTSSAANKAVAWAYKEGIVKGYSDGGIHPTASIVRKDVMIMLYRLAGKPAVSGTLKFPDCKSFKTSSDTYKAILWGSTKGITNGYNSGPYKGQFGVNLNCLREQIVTFLWRYAGKPSN